MKVQSNNNQSVKRFYVYAHKTLGGEVFYIGKGKILTNCNKVRSKYSRAYHFSNRNTFWNNVKNKHGIVVEILKEFDTDIECLEYERSKILEIGRRWLKQGPLTNISEGGEVGPKGRPFKMSEEQRKKLSEIKSMSIHIYNSEGIFLVSVKTIKTAAKYCGVTYNAIHSCFSTKNYTNGYFVFKDYKGENLGYTHKDLDFKSKLAKRVVSISPDNVEVIHDSITDLARYLKVSRESARDAVKRNGTCKKHRVFFEDNQQPSL